MIVGVIGSGSIGPDLAYGFLSAVAKEPGSKVYLNDIKQEALDAGMDRIRGYMKKGVARGKLNPKLAKVMEEAMREVIAVAEKVPVKISEEDIKDWNGILFGLGPEGKTSMLQDVEAGRKTEVEMFAGKVIELGERYRVPTPVNHTLLKLIKVIEQT